ncbi:hypothetical protein CEUSTIGMA_g4373.t1 [Chlamydomonas eustigma]|uniref:Uncharacterized protein n=1 Tax=Chlamydomonas eustigma TaxID=1157962 RepID=A0A250X1J4_9CHLO|nr:hypothetical protein CEUSTIGMA_g4373.t1 [Chlamydomonas eustigma]|eukprot:GAX76926.1 hypothetical protein CEUSTIGMA_g4373.t1 [Chlamydomonas eustigma]
MSQKTLSSVGSVRPSAIAEKSPFLATVDLQVPADVPNASLQQQTSFLPPMSSTLRALDGGAVMRRKSLSDKPFEEKTARSLPLPSEGESPLLARMSTSLSASPLRTSLSAVAPSMNPGRKSIGPGGVPPSNQKDFYRPRATFTETPRLDLLTWQ